MCNILISKEKYNILSKLFEKILNNISNNDIINNSLCDCFIYLLRIYNDKKDKFILNNNFDLNSFSEKLNNEINDELTINFKQPKLTDEKLASDLRILAKIDTSKKYRTSFENRKNDYVGLKNLGCICYMNSTMQQFYMTPTLRYTILKLNDNQKPNFTNTERNKGIDKIDDNMFHQVQKLFSYLLLSERLDYDPYDFIYSFKDFDGNPTKIYEQKDTQEFLAIFLDRLEQSSKNSEYKYMISNIFGGKNCSLITCLECGNVSYRYEPSVFLSLEVKNMKNLNDSLDKYITEEHIDGYECDGCKKNVGFQKEIF